jgi:hypothetical protein
MITSDYIAFSALLISFGNVGYTIYHDKKNETDNIKKEQISYLKSLTQIIKSISFHSTDELKLDQLELVRDELTFCSCYDQNKPFQNLSLELDDMVYVMCTTKNEHDFKEQKNASLSEIRNFKK